jgi:hypothetical protein
MRRIRLLRCKPVMASISSGKRPRPNLLALRYRFLISRRYFLRSFKLILSSLGIVPSVTLLFE